MTPDTCDEYFKSTKVRVLKKTIHCSSIFMANGVVVRTEEINPALLQHLDVVRCPDSHKTYGDIGANAVVVIDTKQTFDFIIPSQVGFKNSLAYVGKKKIYFLNSFLISNDSLRISRNAIKRTDVLRSENFVGSSNSDSTILINIWTQTKKEVRQSLKKCRRSYD